LPGGGEARQILKNTKRKDSRNHTDLSSWHERGRERHGVLKGRGGRVGFPSSESRDMERKKERESHI